MSDATARLLTDRYPVMEVVGVRAMFVVFIILVVSAVRGSVRELKPNNIRGQLIRAVLAAFSVYIFIFGLTLVALSEAAAASYIGPIIMTALAPWMLGERVGVHRWIAVLTGFVGMLFMLQPSAEGLAWGMLVPACAAVFGALRDITTRKIRLTENAASILFVSNLVIALVGASTFATGWLMFTWPDLLMLMLSALLIGAAHYLHIQAFRLEEASVLAPFRYTGIIWAVLLGFLIWGELPGKWVVIGALIVILSGLYIFYRERRRASPPEN